MLLDYDNYTGSEEEIELITETIQNRYTSLSKKDSNIKEKLIYEKRLFCMIFNCHNVDDLIEHLKSKL